MRTFKNNILNEARIQRTIDPKIWASMSSMSSRMRSTLGEDAKVMKKDSEQVLLQKYVAGLLTMKVECPHNISDIDKLKAYKNIGNAYINAGGNITAIQKLYVENGGKFDGEINDEPVSNDYPDYDEVSTDDDTTDTVQTVDEPVTQNHGFDDTIKQHEEPEDTTDNTDIEEEPVSNDYPDYDEVSTNDTEDDVVEEEPVTMGEKYDSMKPYFKTVGNSLRKANVGDFLVWNENDGLVLSNDAQNAIAKCVLTTYKTLDKKPVFMVISDETVTLGNAGNNGVYDDYYFKKKLVGAGQRLQVTAGSNYYYQEEVKGEFYTSILSDNGNNAAATAKSLPMKKLNLTGLNDSQMNEVKHEIVEHAYLPTLPELNKVEDIIGSGRYWTSSVTDKGEANIMLQVNPDKVFKIADPNVKAKVVSFIRF